MGIVDMSSPFTIQRFLMTMFVVSITIFVAQILLGHPDPITIKLMMALLFGQIFPLLFFLTGEAAWQGFRHAREQPTRYRSASFRLAAGIAIMILPFLMPTKSWERLDSIMGYLVLAAWILVFFAVGEFVGIWMERRGRAFGRRVRRLPKRP